MRARDPILPMASLVLVGLTITAGFREPVRAMESRAADDGARSLSLPEVGSWVRYEHTWERLDNGARSTSQMTQRAVGKVVENGEPCRWIEIEDIVADGSEKGTWIYKLLIRERDLQENENPVAGIVRAWLRFNDEPAVAFQPDETGHLPMLLWTPGALRKADVKDEPRTIDYQKGRVQIARARVGEFTLSDQPRQGFRLNWNYTVWREADIPFGLAEARVIYELHDPDKKCLTTQVTTYLLQDAGVDAKSALPENN